MVGRECSEWFGGRLGGRVIVTVVFGGSFGIVNPTRWVGSILRLWIVLPLVPGFPLVCEGLVKGLVVRAGKNHCGTVDLDGSVDVPKMQDEGWLVCG